MPAVCFFESSGHSYWCWTVACQIRRVTPGSPSVNACLNNPEFGLSGHVAGKAALFAFHVGVETPESHPSRGPLELRRAGAPAAFLTKLQPSIRLSFDFERRAELGSSQPDIIFSILH